MTEADFPPCLICGYHDWQTVYEGAVRDGTFGSEQTTRVGRCGGCGVERLAESACLDASTYASDAYRLRIGQDHDIERHYSTP
jgi:hypothetical protein